MSRIGGNRRVPRSAAWLAVLLVVLGGCAQDRRTPAETVGAFSEDRGASQDRGGLELWTLILDDPGSTLSRLAALEENRPPIPDDERVMWRRSGVRVLSVPRAEVESVVDGLPVSRSVERRWLGQPTIWTSVFVGPEVTDRGVAVGGGWVPLVAGRPRLLTRAWVVPSFEGDDSVPARLHIELLPHHLETDQRARGARRAGRAPSLAETGYVFRSLRMSIELDGEQALILVPEDPSVVWEDLATTGGAGEIVPESAPPGPPEPGDALPAPESDAEMSSEPSSKPASIRARRRTVRGADIFPAVPGAPTLGEAMLTAPIIDTIGGRTIERGRRRVVLVLVPTPMGEFRLLGREN